MINTMGVMVDGVMKEFGDLKRELSAVRIFVEGSGILGGEKEEPRTMTRTKTAGRPTTRTKKTTPATIGTSTPSRK